MKLPVVLIILLATPQAAAAIPSDDRASAKPNASSGKVDDDRSSLRGTTPKADEKGRNLSSCQTGAPKWHPQYANGWKEGYCRLTIDCHTLGYTSELACCLGAYPGQSSGYCLSQLPNPPTSSPTDSGGLDVYYPNLDDVWSKGYCINDRPVPTTGSRPFYKTMLECCETSYPDQASGKCISMVPKPPNMSPTYTGDLGIYYADRSKEYPSGVCINVGPIAHGVVTYPSGEVCCAAEYPGQSSLVCVCSLDPSPDYCPTPAPTTSEPTARPTSSPSVGPSESPTTEEPSVSPTKNPTSEPSTHPTSNPTVSPTGNPTIAPTGSPTTGAPTGAPTTETPTTGAPTGAPTTSGSPTLKCQYTPIGEGKTVGGDAADFVGSIATSWPAGSANEYLREVVAGYFGSDAEKNATVALHGPIGGWCFEGVTSFHGLLTFVNSVPFSWDEDISRWDTSKITDMSSMFMNAAEFRGTGLSAWDTSSVTNMAWMFFMGSNFDEDISGWNVTNVEDMNTMFSGAANFNQDISDWNVGKVTDFNVMFAAAPAFSQNLCKWGQYYEAGNTYTSMYPGSGCASEDVPTNATHGWCAASCP